ncbi:hypothetical protein K435DRAFT_936394 [Dendrothele bispora CBS 962.96]|uniref:CCHC-type domain-containing protein n=1 Tax=Dendrothele bispora (strain CBS 962.96) TaxID=1314807 RepID=A0A4S8KZY1_DENBC|nr:hypothetical protein K435DRAFT_936394 [Dendrothele bispora CBS 962.96]
MWWKDEILDDIIKTAVELASRHKPQSAIRGGVGLEQASRSDHVISGSDGLRAVKKEVMQIKSDLAETRAEIKTSNQNNEQLFKKSTTQLQETRKDFEERMLSLKQLSEKEWRNRMEEQNSTWQRQLQQMSWQMHPYQAPTLATPVGYSQSYVPQSVPQVASAQYAQQRPGGGAPAPPQPQFNAGNQRLPSANDNCFFCGVKGHVLANCLELSMYISKGLCQMQGKFVKTVRGDTPPGAGEPGVTLKERLDKFNAANNVQGVAVTVQSVNVAYTRDTYEMEELREALREKERETAQYRQAQVLSQFMNGAAMYQPLPDHPGMKPPEDGPDIQSKEKVGPKPPAKALDGRVDDREDSGGVEKKNPNKYKIPQKKFGGVELEPTVNGRRVPAALFQGVEDVTSSDGTLQYQEAERDDFELFSPFKVQRKEAKRQWSSGESGRHSGGFTKEGLVGGYMEASVDTAIHEPTPECTLETYLASSFENNLPVLKSEAYPQKVGAEDDSQSLQGLEEGYEPESGVADLKVPYSEKPHLQLRLDSTSAGLLQKTLKTEEKSEKTKTFQKKETPKTDFIPIVVEGVEPTGSFSQSSVSKVLPAGGDECDQVKLGNFVKPGEEKELITLSMVDSNLGLRDEGSGVVSVAPVMPLDDSEGREPCQERRQRKVVKKPDKWPFLVLCLALLRLKERNVQSVKRQRASTRGSDSLQGRLGYKVAESTLALMGGSIGHIWNPMSGSL